MFATNALHVLNVCFCSLFRLSGRVSNCNFRSNCQTALGIPNCIKGGKQGTPALPSYLKQVWPWKPGGGKQHVSCSLAHLRPCAPPLSQKLSFGEVLSRERGKKDPYNPFLANSFKRNVQVHSLIRPTLPPPPPPAPPPAPPQPPPPHPPRPLAPLRRRAEHLPRQWRQQLQGRLGRLAPGRALPEAAAHKVLLGKPTKNPPCCRGEGGGGPPIPFIQSSQ